MVSKNLGSWNLLTPCAVLFLAPRTAMGWTSKIPTFHGTSSTPLCRSVAPLIPSQASTARSRTRLYEVEEQKKGFFEGIMDPVATNIPKEMREEINRAEGNTVAGKERSKRITLYVFLAVVLVLVAMFNAFLTELRETVDPDTISKFNELVPADDAIKEQVSLADFGFGWVESNFLFRFLFMSKIGGGGALVSGAIFGLLVEAELDSKRVNAEKIWEEVERRRGDRPTKKKAVTKNAKVSTSSRRPKKQSKKERKRMAALSEVLMEDEPEEEEEEKKQPEEKEEGGIMGKLKEYYDKADSMAASQALLLNKELEDRGVVEKITDETGLKVIGREAAAKLEDDLAEKKEEK